MQVIYFDGKSSKQHYVKIQERSDGLLISGIEDSSINRFWKRDFISSESLSSSKKVLLSYGDFPPERLELTGEGSDHFMIYTLQSENALKKSYQYITRTNPVTLVVSSLATILIFSFSYVYYISPFVGERAVAIIPKEVEVKVGNAMVKNTISLFTVDTLQSEKLQSFYAACGFESEYPIRISYIADDMVNAFAAPGGQIMVFEGLIERTESWEELAALMGHELAHVNQRHSFQQLTRSVASYLLISVMTGDIGGASSILLEQANNVREMANSRNHEKEADIVGLVYLKEIGIRPSAMMDLFKRLMEESELPDDLLPDKMEKTLEFLSTHPLTKNRIKYIQEIIDTDATYDYPGADIADARLIWEELKKDILEKEEKKKEEAEEEGCEEKEISND